jgi:hypothetical protein
MLHACIIPYDYLIAALIRLSRFVASLGLLEVLEDRENGSARWRSIPTGASVSLDVCMNSVHSPFN